MFSKMRNAILHFQFKKSTKRVALFTQLFKAKINCQILRNQSGYSLVEMAVVAGVSALVIWGSSSMVQQFLRGQNTVRSSVELGGLMVELGYQFSKENNLCRIEQGGIVSEYKKDQSGDYLVRLLLNMRGEAATLAGQGLSASSSDVQALDGWKPKDVRIANFSARTIGELSNANLVMTFESLNVGASQGAAQIIVKKIPLVVQFYSQDQFDCWSDVGFQKRQNMFTELSVFVSEMREQIQQFPENTNLCGDFSTSSALINGATYNATKLGYPVQFKTGRNSSSQNTVIADPGRKTSAALPELGGDSTGDGSTDMTTWNIDDLAVSDLSDYLYPAPGNYREANLLLRVSRTATGAQEPHMKATHRIPILVKLRPPFAAPADLLECYNRISDEMMACQAMNGEYKPSNPANKRCVIDPGNCSRRKPIVIVNQPNIKRVQLNQAGTISFDFSVTNTDSGCVPNSSNFNITASGAAGANPAQQTVSLNDGQTHTGTITWPLNVIAATPGVKQVSIQAINETTAQLANAKGTIVVESVPVTNGIGQITVIGKNEKPCDSLGRFCLESRNKDNDLSCTSRGEAQCSRAIITDEVNNPVKFAEPLISCTSGKKPVWVGNDIPSDSYAAVTFNQPGAAWTFYCPK